MQVIPISQGTSTGRISSGTALRRTIAGRRLAVSTSEGIYLLNPSEITYCEAESNYCHIALRDGRKILVSKTLKVIEALLPISGFFRVHQSHIVSLQDVRLIGHHEILMSNGDHIPMSRTRRTEFIARIRECTVGL